MSHAVVVGGAGFVGSWVVKGLLEQEYDRVTVIDNLLSSERWNIPKDPRVEFILGSASDSNTLLRVKGAVDSVFHLACFHGNQSSIANPLMDLENNLKPTLTVLDWVEKAHPNARVVYTGAGCAVAPKTWDTPTGVPEVDETPILHDSPYSISKVTGEMYAKYFADRRGLDVVRVRFQNAYGPGEILGAGQWRGTEHTIWRNVVPTFVWKALHGETLVLHGGGEATRDFVYVRDLARGVLVASDKGKSGEVYNLASGQETTIKQLAEMILKSTSSDSQIEFTERRDWDHSGRRFGDPQKSQSELGFMTEYTLAEGIDSTVKWASENSLRIAATIERHI
ncbi:dTDP-glucose 4,6-dehydratase [mine drainage metagenome]|uniref:dTDP-glucose 4,6-dehydratase n=1 Tax=mine drainage metagenome TaxID=410659 RepID=A0A1J5QES1_9ZZZZ